MVKRHGRGKGYVRETCYLKTKKLENLLPAPYTVRVASQVVGKASWGSAHPLVGWAPPTFSTNESPTPMTLSPQLEMQHAPCMEPLREDFLFEPDCLKTGYRLDMTDRLTDAPNDGPTNGRENSLIEMRRCI